MLNYHRERFRKLTFRALALRQLKVAINDGGTYSLSNVRAPGHEEEALFFFFFFLLFMPLSLREIVALLSLQEGEKKSRDRLRSTEIQPTFIHRDGKRKHLRLGYEHRS